MSINTAVSSGLLSASGVLSSGKNLIKGVLLVPDGTNAPTVTIYNNASAASGVVLFQATGSATVGTYFDFTHAVQADLGLYVQLSGTGSPKAIVYYG